MQELSYDLTNSIGHSMGVRLPGFLEKPSLDGRPVPVVEIDLGIENRERLRLLVRKGYMRFHGPRIIAIQQL